jgi:hypothetical protein
MSTLVRRPNSGIIQAIASFFGTAFTAQSLQIEPLDPDFNDLLSRSGCASYQPKKIAAMTTYEYFNLSHSLALIESDGVDEQEEWNLFEYLPLTFDDFEERPSQPQRYAS